MEIFFKVNGMMTRPMAMVSTCTQTVPAIKDHGIMTECMVKVPKNGQMAVFT